MISLATKLIIRDWNGKDVNRQLFFVYEITIYVSSATIVTAIQNNFFFRTINVLKKFNPVVP